MITRVHHVGVVVRRLEEGLAVWRDLLGLPLRASAEIPDQGVRAALLDCGAAEIELLEPTRPGTGVARFLERRGEAAHHVCLETDDVDGELARLASQGVDLIDRSSRHGLAGRIAFLHPRAAGGPLLELATPPPGSHHGPRAGVIAPLGFRAVSLLVDDVGGALAKLEAILGIRPLAAPAPPAFLVGGVGLEVTASSGATGPPGLGTIHFVPTGRPGDLPPAIRAAAEGPWSSGGALPGHLTGGVPVTIRPPDP